MTRIPLPSGGEFEWTYTARDLTQSVNLLPSTIEDDGINLAMFGAPEGKSSTAVAVVFENGVLRVLETTERDGRPTVAGRGSGETVFLEVPHVPHIDRITPSDLQDMLAATSNGFVPRTLAQELNDRLAQIQRNHQLTRQFMRFGALRGRVYDGAGTLVHDFYDAFGISEKTINLELDQADTDVQAKCRAILTHIDNNLMGERRVGPPDAHVASDLYDKLISHANVEKFFLNWQGAAMAQGDTRRGFLFGGIRWHSVDYTVPLSGGSSQALVASGTGHVVPNGTLDTFRDYNGPVNHVGLANMPGPDVFISPHVLPHGEGIELKSQSNPLPICRRPGLLVKLQAS